MTAVYLGLLLELLTMVAGVVIDSFVVFWYPIPHIELHPPFLLQGE